MLRTGPVANDRLNEGRGQKRQDDVPPEIHTLGDGVTVDGSGCGGEGELEHPHRIVVALDEKPLARAAKRVDIRGVLGFPTNPKSERPHAQIAQVFHHDVGLPLLSHTPTNAYAIVLHTGVAMPKSVRQDILLYKARDFSPDALWRPPSSSDLTSLGPSASNAAAAVHFGLTSRPRTVAFFLVCEQPVRSLILFHRVSMSNSVCALGICLHSILSTGENMLERCSGACFLGFRASIDKALCAVECQ